MIPPARVSMQPWLQARMHEVEASSIGAAMENARCSFQNRSFETYMALSIHVYAIQFWGLHSLRQESGGRFKGKIMRRLMKYKAGNSARDFFRQVAVPLVTWHSSLGMLDRGSQTHLQMRVFGCVLVGLRLLRM